MLKPTVEIWLKSMSEIHLWLYPTGEFMLKPTIEIWLYLWMKSG